MQPIHPALPGCNPIVEFVFADKFLFFFGFEVCSPV